MTDPVATHVRQILELAARKHAAAIAAIERRPIDLDEVRAAQSDLADAELLAEDAYALSGDPHLAEALETLGRQRQMLEQGIRQFETAPPTGSPCKTPWPWISLTIVVAMIAFALL